MWLPLRFCKHTGREKATLPAASWDFLIQRRSRLAKNVHDLSQLVLAMFPDSSWIPTPQQGSHRTPSSIQKLENLPTPPSLPYDPTPSQFKFGLLAENGIFWTLKKTCSVPHHPPPRHGITSVKGNRLAFVTLSKVEGYGQSPKLEAGLVAGGKVWSVDLA